MKYYLLKKKLSFEKKEKKILFHVRLEISARF